MGIDDALVMETKEEIYEMNNGCVCCTGETKRFAEHFTSEPPVITREPPGNHQETTSEPPVQLLRELHRCSEGLPASQH